MVGVQTRLNYDQLAHDFKEWPGLRLLRATNAPFILAFLYREFRLATRTTIPYAEFLEHLERYRDIRHAETPDLYGSSPHEYVNEWAKEHFIHIKFLSEQPLLVSLGSGTASVLTWLENWYDRSFVGAESRISHLVQWLQEIKQETTDDVESRLGRLKREQDRLQQQIDLIQQTGQITRTLSDTQLRELYLEIRATAHELESDFSLIEHRFQEMALTLRNSYHQNGKRKGELVGQVLDIHEEIKQSDQGKSFYAFWQFLRTPNCLSELYSLLHMVSKLPALQSISGGTRSLEMLPEHLIQLSGDVMRSLNRAIAQLRRILDGKSIAEHQRLKALLAEVRQLAMHIVEAPQAQSIVWKIETHPELVFPLAYRFWQPKEEQHFSETPMVMSEDDWNGEELSGLFEGITFQKEELIERIAQVLEDHPEVTLTEVVKRYPLTKGFSEVILYCHIAEETQEHSIDAIQTEDIPSLSADGESSHHVIRCPLLTFRRRSYVGMFASTICSSNPEASA